MSLSLWLSLVAVCALGAMSPGPSLALVLRHTLGGGRASGVSAGVAHAFGVGVYALLTVWGLGALMARQPLLFQLISWAGAAYLAWLGIQALRSRPGEFIEPQQQATARLRAARDGLLVAFGNPKLVVFFVALLSQFVTPDLGLAGKLIIVLTAMLIDASWYVLVALTLSNSRILPLVRRQAHWLQRLTGVVLLGLALRVLWGVL